MAVGDVVSIMYNAVNGTFQPAATVQICITNFIGTGDYRVYGVGDIDTGTTILYSGTYDGTDEHNIIYWANSKRFISNTSYYTFVTAAGYGGFTGIQTQ